MADPNRCIEWPKSRNPYGYGQVRREGRGWLAHRWVWTLIHGPVPAGRLVRHLCPNPACVNVNHLTLDPRPSRPKAPRPRPLLLAERLWRQVDKTEDCWLWTGYIMSDSGYGQIQRGRRGEGAARAHIVAWELLVGPVPAGMILHHTCEVKHCVNPAHLEPMTRADHIREHQPQRRRNDSRLRLGRAGADPLMARR